MKKLLLLLCFLTYLPSNVQASVSLPQSTSSPRTIKIVNQRRHKLMLGELSRALEASANTLSRYKRQNELNKTLPARSRIIPKKSDLQKHLTTYAMLKNIYDKYAQTEQLLIPLELLTDLVRDEALLEIILAEEVEQKRMQKQLATTLIDEQMVF